jgi:hypothetical protein
MEKCRVDRGWVCRPESTPWRRKCGDPPKIALFVINNGKSVDNVKLTASGLYNTPMGDND